MTKTEGWTMVETTLRERPIGHRSRTEKVSGMPLQRNKYTSLVERYWREYFPDQVAGMVDSEAFFCQQAEALADRVAELERSLAEPVPEGEGYVARVGRLTAARLRAEEMAIAELLPTPENDEDLAETSQVRRMGRGEDENRRPYEDPSE